MKTDTKRQAPIALTVAGSDSGCMAGMQADLLTFAANGVYGVAAVTCVTAQSPEGVSQIETLQPDFVISQAEEVKRYFKVKAAKTGLLCNKAIIEHVVDFFSRNPEIPLVVDPVMVATNGRLILDSEAIKAYKEQLLPLASVITPNLDEAQILLGTSLRNSDDFETAAKEMAVEWNATVYLKGGHLEGETLYDIACDSQGALNSYVQKRIHDIDTHGSGCTLSACVASQLAKRSDPFQAIEHARAYLRKGMERPVFHSGKRYINHFPKDPDQ